MRSPPVPALKLILAAALLLAPTALRALELVLAPVAEPVPYALKDVEPDVRGIAPGMTEAEVRAELTKLYPGARQEAASASVTYANEGRIFRSKPLLTQISVRQPNATSEDDLTVHFGLPTSRTPVLGLARRMDFALGPATPSMAQLTAQVIAKYGPPAVQRPGVGPGGVTLIWLFGAGKARACGGKAPACPFIAPAFSIARLDAYRALADDGFELMIQVDLIGHGADPARVKSFKTVLADNRGAVLSYEAAQSQIIALVEAAAATPPAAPAATPAATTAGLPRP